MKHNAISITLIIIGILFSYGSYTTAQQNKTLKKLTIAFREEKQKYHILQAEYSYLTNPIRLKAIQEKYFPTYVPIDPKQIKSFNSLVQ